MCMVHFGDDRATIYRGEDRRARKPWRCDECSRTIGSGEPYHFAAMLFEDRWSMYRTCAHCRVAMHWLMANCGGFLHCGVWEDLEEHINEYPQLAFPLSRLKVARRRGWKRFDGAGLMPAPPVPPTLEEVGLESHH